MYNFCKIKKEKKICSPVNLLHIFRTPLEGWFLIHESLKNSYLKKFSYQKYKLLANLNPRAALYEHNRPRIEVGLQLN